MPRKLVYYPEISKGSKVVTNQFSFLSNNSSPASPKLRASSAAYSHGDLIEKSQVCRSFSDSHSLAYSTKQKGQNGDGDRPKPKTASHTNLTSLHLSPDNGRKVVVRRNKSPLSGSNSDRRRGMIFNISPPMVDAGAPKRNGASSLADQEKMLQQLIDDSCKKAPEPQPVVVVNRGRMADRIQRTIRALYEGGAAKIQNSSAKNSPQVVRKRGSTKTKDNKQKNRGAFVTTNDSGVGMVTKPEISSPIIDPDAFKNTLHLPPLRY